MREGFPQLPKPTPEEEERAKRAYEKADPTTFSELSPKLEKQTDKKIDSYPYGVHQTAEGEKYVDLSKKKRYGQKLVAREQVVARLLKGIIPVSDVVSVSSPRFLGMGHKKRYFSKVMQFERMHDKSASDPEVDIVLLSAIFNDRDHAYSPHFPHNMRVGVEKTAFFDFGGFADFASEQRIPTYTIRKFSDAQRQELLSKAQEFKERISGSEGKTFIESIISSTGEPISKLVQDPDIKEIEEFQAELIRRADAVIAAVPRQSEEGEVTAGAREAA